MGKKINSFRYRKIGNNSNRPASWFFWDAVFVRTADVIITYVGESELQEALSNTGHSLVNRRKIIGMSTFETLVLSVLLYKSETWTLITMKKNRLKIFEVICLRKIGGSTNNS